MRSVWRYCPLVAAVAVWPCVAQAQVGFGQPPGAVAYWLDSLQIMASGARSLSELLQARLPGLSVLQPGGVSAQGAQIRERGVRSYSFDSGPIVLVDGIRVDAMQDATLASVGVSTSRVDDIAPEDIARIDVLPGAAAASLYGAGGAGGALVITTKRGGAGLHVGARAQSSLGFVRTSFPTNYQLVGTSTSTGQPTRCVLQTVASGDCAPTRLDTWNPLENASPFRTARMGGGSIALSGGAGPTTARLGVTGSRTRGVTSDDDDGRLSVRARLVEHLWHSLTLDGSGGYLRASSALPVRGFTADASNVIANGLLGSAVPDTLQGYRSTSSATSTREHTEHSTLGLTTSWDPLRWLHAAAEYGRDQVNERDDQVGSIIGYAGPYGQRALLDHTLTTAAASATAVYRLSALGDSVFGHTRIGYQTLKSILGASDTVPMGFAIMHANSSAGGPVLRQEFHWSQRLFVGVGARSEGMTTFGARSPRHWFKSADASWTADRVPLLEWLRLRAAYGEAANWSPGDPRAVTSFDLSGPLAALRAPQEHTAETELGADFGIGAVAPRISLTVFRADASHLWTGQPSAPPGFPPPEVSGAIRNEGLEAAARLQLLRRHEVEWTATAIITALRNRVRSVGIAPLQVTTNGLSRPGDPVASYWQYPYTYADVNQDGILTFSEIQSSTGERRLLGWSLPSREAAVSSSVTLATQLTLSALLDYRGGQKLANMNEELRCQRIVCRAANDTTAPLADQAAALLLFRTHVEDASFVKLRELSLRWALPARAAALMGGDVALTIIGRNLATFTGYKGLDPEANAEPINVLPRLDFAETPLPREIILRLDYGR